MREAVGDLVGADLSVADHGELASAARAVARLRAFVDLAKVHIARRGRELAEGGDTSSAHSLIDEGRCTGLEASATSGRDRLVDGRVNRASARERRHFAAGGTVPKRVALMALSVTIATDFGDVA